MQRYKIVLSYRGTKYYGWQAANNEDHLPTVQGTLQKVMEPIVGHPLLLVGSSRTDAGVHAKGQVVHFDTTRTQIPSWNFRKVINDQLPEDIAVRTIEPVDNSFNAILDTHSKRYQYIIWQSHHRPVMAEGLVWYRDWKHNVDRMREAAQHIVGTHDFKTFCKTGHKRLTTVRTVYRCTISDRGPMIVIGVEGGGFLWNMVRIIAGTLSEVGIGRFKADDIPAMIQAKDRQVGGMTAPAGGLYLQWVRYKKPDEPASAEVGAEYES